MRPPCDAVDHLHLLEGERDLVEIAEDQLVERQLRFGDPLVEIDVAMPPRRLGGFHLGGHAIDPDLVATLLLPAPVDEGPDQRFELLAGFALGHD
jgi:hypothetical protein